MKLIRINKFIEMRRNKKEQEKQELKNHVISKIIRDYTEQEIHDFNCSLLMNSAGWLGGDWDEKNIKFHILNNNRQLFSDEEYEYYKNIIYPKVKKLSK